MIDDLRLRLVDDLRLLDDHRRLCGLFGHGVTNDSAKDDAQQDILWTSGLCSA